jgi:hypothetical protein
MIHHGNLAGKAPLGLKAPDTQTIPLCEKHHTGAEGIHTRREWWVQTYGQDTDYLPGVSDALAGQFNSPWRRK